MNKSLLLILGVVFVVLSAAGAVVGFTLMNNQQTTNNSTNSTNSSTNSPTSSKSDTTIDECMVGCQSMWKTNSGNEGKTDDDMRRDCTALCQASQGIEDNDLSSCEKSTGVLKDTCYFGIASDTKDVTICEKVTDKTMKDSCYSEVAEKTGDKSLCNKISSSMLKMACESSE
jgi:hypothetical protein